MTRFLVPTYLLCLLLSASCTNNHLIRDKGYRQQVSRDFELRKELAAKRDNELFSPFREKLTSREKEALQFLFAYMPLSDLADYNGDFFLANSRYALAALEDAVWRDSIPDYIFLHYVLPPRINNENLDSFRIAYYNEIRQRISGMPLIKAALEINYWCQEKVTYQPADIRTSAPMSTILSARGRCGEESTFTVAALRTAGIPARQVYTPRWAHTDDNHAWVEIWHNGEWFYMGACEPEPIVDRGWFTEPARRAMLVHTKSFGAHYGDENLIRTEKNYSEVNNLAKYAETKTLTVHVTDRSGIPAQGANVEFGLYNYAEFYPITAVKIGVNGTCKLETGFGDLVVWASDNGLFGFRHVPAAFMDTVRLALIDSVPELASVDIDIEVPQTRIPFPAIPSDLAKKNTDRINKGISIRQDYINGWMSSSDAYELAKNLSLDTSGVISAISRSMGNYREIARFLEAAPDTLGKLAVELLEILPDKDLRDTRSGTLLGHLTGCASISRNYDASDREFLLENVINPRVDNEILSDWRSWFRANLPESLFLQAGYDPSVFVAYLNDNVRIAEEENYYETPLTPRGVISLGVSDTQSRAICFVALCRTAGIASRLEPGTGIPQFFKSGNWEYVWFSDQVPLTQVKGNVTLVAEGKTPEPEYYTHFTFARLENGRFRTLHFDNNFKVSGFDSPLALLPGYYRLVTGNRLSDGRVLVRISFFRLDPGENIRVDVALRQKANAAGKGIKVDLTSVLKLFDVRSMGQGPNFEKGIVLVWAEPETEPNKHILNDIRSLKKEFDTWGGCFLFLSGEDSKISGFRPASSPELPENSFFAVDDAYAGLAGIVRQIPGENISVPFLLVSDPDGNVAYTSSGYKIGTGEHILKNINLPVDK